MKSVNRFHELVARYQVGQITDDELLELEAALKASEEARAQFHQASRIDSGLRREAESSELAARPGEVIPISKTPSRKSISRRPVLGRLGVGAAIVLLSALTWAIAAQKRVIATLVSSEGASWESVLPTVEGSELTRGTLRLKSGIATIRFESGTVMTLEAPARVFIKTPRKANLLSGTIVLKGNNTEDFTLEAKHGQAVFREAEIVIVREKQASAIRFQTLAGSVYVSHDQSREVVKLNQGDSAVMMPVGLKANEISPIRQPFEPFERGIRISSSGRSATFIRNNAPHKWTRPELLGLKESKTGSSFDQYAVVGFDLAPIDGEQVDTVAFRANLVPSGIGLVSRLPKLNQFSVYGLVNSAKENWTPSDQWENAPSAADGELVGTFEIPRNQQRGTVEVLSEELSEFVRERAGETVTFVVVRDSGNNQGVGHGLTHALASDSHPEAVGPILEITLRD